MTKLDIIKAVNDYNSILLEIGWDHSTIDTAFSEDTAKWNLRDMVAECDYILSGYYESGHASNELRYSDNLEDRKTWAHETKELENFISTYEKFINEMECSTKHCSKYDN